MYKDGLAGLCRRAKKRKEEMRSWYILWEELAHFFHNNRKGFIVEQTPGQETAEDIWNSSPEDYRRKHTEAMVSAMCPKDRMWLGMEPARTELMQSANVRAWLQIASLYMYTVLYDPLANWTERLNELADDTKSFGTGVIYIDHDKVGKKLNMMVPHLKNFAFEMDANGMLTRQYCFWNLSLDDLVDKFGIDSLPIEMQEAYRNPTETTHEKKHCVLHAIIPNEDYARFGLAPGRLPFRSLWVLEKGYHLLDEAGFYSLPYVVVRWFRRSDEVPGRTDCMQMLPDARLIQAVSAALLEITEKQGNPPMQMPVDVLRGEVELFPGGVTMFDAPGFQYQGDPLRPVQLGANPAMTAEYLQYLEQKIAKGFQLDILSLPVEGKMTSDEAIGRQMMLSAVLGPVWSRVENEMLPPILDRVFDIMMRSRSFPPIPEELVGERLIYKFDNHIADMREAAEAQRIVQGIGVTLQFERPEAVENMNWDVAVRDLWRRMKVPEAYVLPIEQVMANRQQRMELEQAAQMAEVAKAGGPGVKQMIEGAVTARDQGLIPQ